MMQLVADESVDYRIISALRDLGIAVFAIIEELPSSNDTLVLELAVDKDWLLITQDKDFGEMIFRMRQKHCGVLLIRLAGLTAGEYSWLAEEIVSHYDELQNSFAVMKGRKLRFRRH